MLTPLKCSSLAATLGTFLYCFFSEPAIITGLHLDGASAELFEGINAQHCGA